MLLVSWNVNGIRAIERLLSSKKRDFASLFKKELNDPDVVCLQETKVSSFHSLGRPVTMIKGYRSFWAFTLGTKRKGYSGVAVYVKKSVPVTHVREGFGNAAFIDEGRCLEVHIGNESDGFVLFNVYFPNGGRGPHREEYKMKFNHALRARCQELQAQERKLIICGDFNIAHTEMDIHDPTINHSGFLPEERQFFGDWLGDGLVDTYRRQHPLRRNAYTYWDTISKARDRNQGWRIDYFVISREFYEPNDDNDSNEPHNGIRADIQANVFGSDHCPVTLRLNATFTALVKRVHATNTCEKLACCASSQKKFKVRQRSLVHFFSKAKSATSDPSAAKVDTANDDSGNAVDLTTPTESSVNPQEEQPPKKKPKTAQALQVSRQDKTRRAED
ncbi:MAG: hypothetical protein MHM6MM_000472 [Cercozoa sp. M6MM]